MHLDQSRENLLSPLAQWQKIIAQRYADFPLNLSMVYEPSQGLPRDLAALEKRERIRKTIAAIGVTILMPLSLFSCIFGGGAFSKTLSSEERKKRIKWIVIGVLLMVMSSYWNEIVTRAVVVFMG